MTAGLIKEFRRLKPPGEVPGTPNILVVEDCQNDMDMMAHVLERMGCNVIQAASGEQACEHIREALTPEKQDIHIVFLDLRLPGMDGREVLARIKALAPNLPVVIVTGAPYLDIDRMSYVGCIQKPLAVCDVDEILRKHRLK